MSTRLSLALLVSLLLPGLAAGQNSRFTITRPDGKTNFITDQANLIAPEDEKQINTLAAKLLQAKATPIIVVTIPSMAAVGGQPGMDIESFARQLFDDWGIGHPEIRSGNTTKKWNTGILLLVSEGDRKARIELGAGWAHKRDTASQQIMDDLIIPQFKKGDFSQGILLGVQALNNMCRDLELPKPKRPWWHFAIVAGAIGLAIFTVISLIRRGSSGWAWLFWGVVFSIVGMLLYSMLANRGGSGGGFSGGSFGGGFGGGGGATGSW
jgi:uncharacterized protein